MCGWGAAKWGRQEEQVGAIGPLLKGGSGREKMEYPVYFPYIKGVIPHRTDL